MQKPCSLDFLHGPLTTAYAIRQVSTSLHLHRNEIETEKAYLPPANVVCEGYVFTPVCDSVNRGGGMCGFIWGACVVLFGGHAWFYLGGCAWFHLGGHVWFYLGGCAWFYSGACVVLFRGACVVLFGGACVVLFGGAACMVLFGGHAWFYSGGAWFYSGHAWFYLGGACVVFSVFLDTMRYGQ